MSALSAAMLRIPVSASNLIPETPGTAPNYFCTWNIQGYVASYTDGNTQRNALTETNLFSQGRFENWADFYLRIRGDLLFVMDDSWDVGFSNYDFGRDILSPERFPSFASSGTEPEKLKNLNTAFQARGWRAVGGWICANKGASAPVSDHDFYVERLRWMHAAGWGYWKVDWGQHASDAAWRHELTDWAHAFAPKLVVEHAQNWECIPFADTFRTYDVEAVTSIPVTLGRVGSALRFIADAQAGGIINCEDEPIIGAALGCAIGIMRHPLAGNLPDGRQDFAFPPVARDLKHCLNEVERGVIWHRVAPPFRVDGQVTVDTNQLTDIWCFHSGESWVHTKANTWVTNSAPARIARGGLPLPEVRIAKGEPPFVIASRNPNGVVTVATLGRTFCRTFKNRYYRTPLADVTLDLENVPSRIGVFGKYSSLTLKFTQSIAGSRILAQDILATEARDITQQIHLEGNTITIPGSVIKKVGLAAASPGDKSDPGVVLVIAANPPRLRGTPMVLGKNYGASVAFATDIKNWEKVKALGLNTVRICHVDAWFVDRKNVEWTPEQALPWLDKCVANAQATGMNIIINYHNTGEQDFQEKAGKPLDFTRVAEFWHLVAPRYREQTNVCYELNNEPSFGGGTFFKPEFHRGLMQLYRQVRQDAPQRTILLFSFNALAPDLKDIVDTYAAEIDWAHTLVAFHFYGGDGTSKVARKLVQAYPSTCTEWDYPGAANYVKPVDGKLMSAENCENLGVGWIDWRSWGDTNLDRIQEKLIPDAKAKGYWWGIN